MNNINFTAKLVIDPKLTGAFKRTQFDEINSKLEKFLNSPVSSKLIHSDEVVLLKGKSGGKNQVLMKINDKTVVVGQKDPITPMRVVNTLLKMICDENNLSPKPFDRNQHNFADRIKQSLK